MKASYVAVASVALPAIVSALWRVNVTIATAALGAIGYTCATGAIPNCAIAAAAAVIITALTAINGGTNSGTDASPVRRDVTTSVSHILPNGTVHDYLNTAALEHGVWHTVLANGHTLSASKHPDGHNILNVKLEATQNNSSTRRSTAAVDPNAIQEITVQFGDRNWPVANQWSQDEVNDMASTVLNTDNLDAQEYCSTILDDTDADTFDMSWAFDTTNHYHTEYPPPCGA